MQNDIKRVLAYSTVSQLGYMVLAMGVGAYTAGIFHLYTHAFFKALLFLGSGAVIHALAGEQDLRRMGGLRKELPLTYWTFLIGALAIAGVPGLAGFFSKDEILYRTFASGHVMLWAAGLVTSLLTAIYMFRLVFLAFHGDAEARPARARAIRSPTRSTRRPQRDIRQSAPATCTTPRRRWRSRSSCWPSARSSPDMSGCRTPSAGRTASSSFSNRRWVTSQPAPEAAAADDHTAERTELTLMAVSSVVALSGIGIAAFFFLKRRDAAETLAARFAGLRTLLLNKYYVDEIYDAVIVQPIRIVSEHGLWKIVDARIIDGAVNGAAEIVAGTSAAAAAHADRVGAGVRGVAVPRRRADTRVSTCGDELWKRRVITSR